MLYNDENLNFIFSDWTLFRKYKKEINEKIESADTKSVLIIEINEDVSEQILLCEKAKYILICNPKKASHLNKYLDKVNLKIEIDYQDWKEFRYDDLTDDSKLKLIQSEVMLQNKLIKLQD